MTPNRLQSQNGRWIGNKLPSPFVLEKLLTAEVRGSKNSLQLVDYLGAHPMFLMSPTQSLLQVNQKGVRSNGCFAISFTKNEMVKDGHKNIWLSSSAVMNGENLTGSPKSDLIDGLFGLLVFFFNSAIEGERIPKSVTK